MAPARRSPWTHARLASLAIVVAIASAACTGESSTTSEPSATQSPSPLPTGPIEFVPGSFVLQVAGVKADLDWKRSGIRLQVDNAGEEPIGEPSIYVITHTQDTVDGSIAGAAEIDGGAGATFDVTFPEELVLDDVGLVILSFGGENYGAMAPEIAA